MMKHSAIFLAMVFAFSLMGAFPESCLAKKGGIGHGGGYSDEGILYHSHSDRSYSGKGMNKGKAIGHSREKKMKTGKGKGRMTVEGNDLTQPSVIVPPPPM